MSQVTAPEPVSEEEYASVEIVGGREYMTDASGRLVPIEHVKASDLIIDQTVRKVLGFAEELSERVTRFKGHTFDDIHALQDLIAEQYGASVGGPKGNITLTSYDGRLKVMVQKHDQITFGPELQIAKQLVDKCIAEWAKDSKSEIRILVEHAFQVDKQGLINRAALFALRRVQIDDEGWLKAMEALTDSMRTIGTATYVRFFRRGGVNDSWCPVTINLAAA